MILRHIILFLFILIVTCQEKTPENMENSETLFGRNIKMMDSNNEQGLRSPINTSGELMGKDENFQKSRTSKDTNTKMKNVTSPGEFKKANVQGLQSKQVSEDMMNSLLNEFKRQNEKNTSPAQTSEDIRNASLPGKNAEKINNETSTEKKSNNGEDLGSPSLKKEINNIESRELRTDDEVLKSPREYSQEMKSENENELGSPKNEKTSATKGKLHSMDLKFKESELNDIKELTDKLRSNNGVTLAVAKSYLKILCKFCAKHSCRPKCVDDRDCHSQLACEQGSCIHLCSERIVCGRNTECTMLNHKALCTCKPGFTGNPKRGCMLIGSLSDQGCFHGSKCPCSNINDCPSDLTCVKSICVDLCLMGKKCGREAVCKTLNHDAVCMCKTGFTGNPLLSCQAIGSKNSEICPPNSCGPNTQCKVVDNNIICKCLPKFVGNPWRGCRPGCKTHTDCIESEACIQHICRSACKLCGKNAICVGVNNNKPICKCPVGYSGNPLTVCVMKRQCNKQVDCPRRKPVCDNFKCVNPCTGACATNALCIIKGNQAECICPEFYFGDPAIQCRPPPCLPGNNCPGDWACIEGFCVDLCRRTKKCGKNALCRVQANKPVCICRPGFTGDPLYACKKIEGQEFCQPNSCGKNAECKVVDNKIICKCFPKHIGNPWRGCRPGCKRHTDCKGNEACIKHICRSGCKLCGHNAICEGVNNNKPICKCPPGHSGNPYKDCIMKPECNKHNDCPRNKPVCNHYKCVNPCVGACGANALCKIYENRALCYCPEFFFGYPSIACRPPACLPGEKCPFNLACKNGTCLDLCRKTKKCGKNALCRISSNEPVCICKPDFTGDPLDGCSKIKSPGICPPNSCGPNTKCESFDHKIICKCLPKYVGNPWKGCRKGCKRHTDCKEKEACIENICQDACKLCAKNALCEGFVGNKPICKCRQGFGGNPYQECKRLGDCIKNSDCPSTKPVCKQFKCQNPCDGACGVDAICNIKNFKAICSCPNYFVGDPLVKCKRIACLHEHECKCTNNRDCPENLACVKGICVDLCLMGKKCGAKAVCIMRTHDGVCRCEPGFTGNPLRVCQPIKQPASFKKCPKSPCGPNTICIMIREKPLCKCSKGFIGNPWEGCRRQCKRHIQCNREEICTEHICQDACKLCGKKAICQRLPWQKPICKCHPGYTGNPYKDCKRIGDCITNADCPSTKPLCKQFKCQNPCNGACGVDALCKIKGVEAICSCPVEYTGDPLVKCKRMNCRHEHECKCINNQDCPETLSCMKGICVDLCLIGKKCGKKAVCHMRKHEAICLCKTGFTGNPLRNCEPICYSQKDCPANLACKNNTCSDLCKTFKNCGRNAVCKIIDNEAMCICPPGFTGNPHNYCKKVLPMKACSKSPCGPNTVCILIRGKPLCKCLPYYVGNPWERCRRSCKVHIDCNAQEICLDHICQDACQFCGIRAVCERIPWHEPICTCPTGYNGNAYKECKRIGNCITHADCPSIRPVCKQFNCQNPCKGACGIDAICNIKGDEAICSCPAEYTGDPLKKCRRMNCRHEHECKCIDNQDCPVTLSCTKGTCVDRCLVGKRCGKNAACHMRKHEAICLCEPGFTGDPLRNCEPPCFSQKDCPFNFACKNSICVDLCKNFKKCGRNAECKIVDNEPKCICPPSFTGNPLNHCKKIVPVILCPKSPCGPNTACILIRGKPLCKCLPNFVGNPWEGCRRSCKLHINCNVQEICIEHICQEPCKLCGKTAICEKIPWNEPICKCPLGYNGNAYKECKRIGNCITHADCPSIRPVCKHFNCQNPCRGACGMDADCKIKGGEAVCSCPVEYTGNPLVKCKRMNCRHEHECKCINNHDCPETLSCVKGICVDLCLMGKKCGKNAICHMRHHEAICICEPGLTGNPLIKCEPPCFSQKDCPTNLACRNNTCVDLCKKNKNCGTNAKCKIMNNEVVCICAPGFTGNSLVKCSKIESLKICPKSPCGPNTICIIVKKKPVCKCLPKFVGNPWRGCRKTCKSYKDCSGEDTCIEHICQDGCKICGKNALCQRIFKQKPICECPPGFTGYPYKECKRIGDCTTNADCPSTKPICKRFKCQNPCRKACGVDAICNIRGVKAICSCPVKYTGNPLVKCKRMEEFCPINKCGPNTICLIVNQKTVCKCLPNYVGNPWRGCQKKCKLPTDCRKEEVCIKGICQDPCKLCGKNAICQRVPWKKPECKCLPNHTGNPYKECKRIGHCKTNKDCPPKKPLCKFNKCHNPCDSDCGIDAICHIRGVEAHCFCPNEYTGDPLTKCKRIVCLHEHECKCSNNHDCPANLSCVKGICVDTCLTSKKCGKNAVCEVKVHNAICTCKLGFTGDPLRNCQQIIMPQQVFCPTNTCGPNTICLIVNKKTVCKCLPNYVGNPWKGCQKKCKRPTDCSKDEICIKGICQDACKLCGKNAICQRVPWKKPECKCLPSHIGNPYKECKRIGYCNINADCPPTKPVCKQNKCQNPCDDACGYGAICQIRGVKPICSCRKGYVGDPAVVCRYALCGPGNECKCNTHDECPGDLACVKGICVDLCLMGKKCGLKAVCVMHNHEGVCKCKPGLTGNPLQFCQPISPAKPCGPGHNCECISNNDCPLDLACVKGICVDLCLTGGKCGSNAMCIMNNHNAVCKCKPGMTGDPLQLCNSISSLAPLEVCPPNSCGKNSKCKIVNSKIFCKCIPSFFGNPWEGCQPQCRKNSDCSSQYACIKYRCQHSCNLCGKNAFCEGAVNHKAICKCLPNHTGNPYKLCTREKECSTNADCPQSKPLCDDSQCKNPCDDACGISASCTVKEMKAVCYCQKHFIGNPWVICRPKPCTPGNCNIKCVNNQQCPSNMTCLKGTCVNECSRENICRNNAECKMVKHKAICTCRPGYTGNPMDICNKLAPVEICLENPCGPNTLCLKVNNKKLCICLSKFIGNPWEGCRPQCKVDHDCNNDHACIDNICQSPCKLCGIYDICRGVQQHRPICECPAKFSMECKEKPECVRNSDCPRMKPICNNFKCENPCDGICGINALCDVGGLKPICYCPVHYTGNPYVFCKPESCLHAHECKCLNNRECPEYLSCVKGICVDLCLVGKKCGQNAVCVMKNQEAICECEPGFNGNPNRICQPYSAKPACSHKDECKCKKDRDCPYNLSCVRGICVDLCLIGKKCGKNAMCRMESHNVLCICAPGLTGDPLQFCRPISTKPKPDCQHGSLCKCSNSSQCPENLSCMEGICVDLCVMGKKCGFNAVCIMRSHEAICKCRPGLTGDPLLACEQTSSNFQLCLSGSKCKCADNSQCPGYLSCVKGICVDLCLMGMKCGKKALCRMHKHEAVCTCEVGFTGNPLKMCNPIAFQETFCLHGNECKCLDNRNCPRHLSCVKGICVDLCLNSIKCGIKAVCIMHDHKAVCTCRPGFTGNPHLNCQAIYVVSTCPPGHICKCSESRECPKNLSCLENFCVNSCLYGHKCGIGAVCTVHNHEALCTCIHGFTGNPSRICQPIITLIPSFFNKCFDNRNCPIYLSCLKGICVDLCLFGHKCGLGSVCSMHNHKAICTCPPGVSGNPLHSCQMVYVVSTISSNKCSDDRNCPEDLCCMKGICTDLCKLGHSCGANAVCKMHNHKAVCSCADGLSGDPLHSCQVTDIVSTKSCEYDRNCAKNLSCVKRICVDLCLSGHKCGTKAICKMQDHKAVCTCPPGLSGNPLSSCQAKSTLTNSCENDRNCAKNLSCVKRICVDLCLSGHKCGTKAICKMQDHKSVCTCPPGLSGNPLSSCQPKSTLANSCENDRNCATNLSCVKRICVDLCLSGHKCGTKAICKMQDHKAVCTCPPGLSGNPLSSCQPKSTLANSCENDRNCAKNLSCVKRICVDLCLSGHKCGTKAICKMQDHKAVCTCPPGLSGNPLSSCQAKSTLAKSCRCNRHCPKNLACRKRICVDLCLYGHKCGNKAICTMQNHKAKCKCPPGLSGNPRRCCRPKSTSKSCRCNRHCPKHLACRKRICVDLCLSGHKCGNKAICTMQNHKAKCKCPPGLSGNPRRCCRPKSTSNSCRRNRHCPKHLACRKRICVDLCLSGHKCGNKAICTMQNHKAKCKCPPGLSGNPRRCCRPKSTSKSCRCNRHCPKNLACRKRICVDLCLSGHKCGNKAICTMQNHKAKCKCPPGLRGNPRRCCRPKRTSCLPGIECKCSNDKQCPGHLSCVRNICTDLCSVDSKCGQNAICSMQKHRTKCICAPGFTGDPLLICTPIDIISPCLPGSKCKCSNILKCPSHLACVKGLCVDLCSLGHKCGIRAICIMQNHQPICRCGPEFTGNPKQICQQISPVTPCLPGIGCGPTCMSNRECPEHLDCERGICIDKCSWKRRNRCAINTECVMINHKPVCICKPGYYGDPLRGCKLKNETSCDPEIGCGPACVSNSDCPDDLSCTRGICINKCLWKTKLNCAINATCAMNNHKPVCICKPGYTGDPLRNCEKIKGGDVCPPSMKCGKNAACIMKSKGPVCTCLPGFIGNPSRGCQKIEEIAPTDVCSPSPCGANTVCLVIDHKPYCKCLPKYVGNPSEGCYHSCEIDFDCNKTQACIEHECQSPCKLCGKNAKCEGTKRHRPRCKCPLGYMGNPYKECKPKPECTTHTDCPRFKPFCNQTRCRNPCEGACGIKAICYVVGIKAECSCPKPLTGDPKKICVPPGISRLCRQKPCGTNSKCEIQINKMGRYIAVCKCLPGYHEHNNQCFIESCSKDDECVDHKACINSTCKDPCEGRCGIKTTCKTVNHKPTCSCLNGFEGNPDIGCKPEKVKPCVLLKICPKK